MDTESAQLRLMRESEQRIERMNEMVCRLADATIQLNNTLMIITKEYTRQLDRLQECRDRLSAENAELIRANEKLLCAATQPRHIINNN